MLWLIVVMLVCLFIGLPMMMPLTVGSFFLLFTEVRNLSPMFFIQQIIGNIEPYVLLAIPMFIFTADVISKGESADRLVEVVRTFVGHISGGLAITTSVACILFGSISGSTQATVAAVGVPVRKRLLKSGYQDSKIMALIINSSDISILIPPSSVMILYAVVTGTSVGELFIAGIVPGVLIGLAFSVYSYISARYNGIPREPRCDWRTRLIAVKNSLWAFGFPVIIIGGIYSGVFSPTEAAATAAFYALALELFVYRKITLWDVGSCALSTGMVTAIVFILIGIGGGFSVVMSYAGIPQMISRAALGVDPSALRILIVVSVFYFFGCMFVDSLVVILVATPIFFPAAIAAGIDPVFLGIVVTMQAAIGTATPPFGCDIFTAIAVFDRPYWVVIRDTPPYIIILLVIAALLIAFPDLALGLRNLAYGY